MKVKGNVIVLWLGIVASGWTTTVTAEDGDDRCSESSVMTAMTSCQGERQQLSSASQANSTAELCRALQLYSDCMRPKIDGCQGGANAAFSVILSKYANEPFNCRLLDSTSTINEANSFAPDGTKLHNDSANKKGNLATADDFTGPSHQQPYAVDILATTTLTVDVTQEVSSTAATPVKVDDSVSHSTPHKKSFDPHNAALREALSTGPTVLAAVMVHCFLFMAFL
ncbi:unnamed protein product [Lymnaea stagnalis]|uniref:Uncharacterized protein n=1 Tax=Lymnaea stagnalis TaxID=6523 RepID=A0AAV2ILM3_LYMST